MARVAQVGAAVMVMSRMSSKAGTMANSSAGREAVKNSGSSGGYATNSHAHTGERKAPAIPRSLAEPKNIPSNKDTSL